MFSLYYCSFIEYLTVHEEYNNARADDTGLVMGRIKKRHRVGGGVEVGREGRGGGHPREKIPGGVSGDKLWLLLTLLQNVALKKHRKRQGATS